jgi:hypothetical protein
MSIAKHFVGGCGAVSLIYGVWQIYVPAGWIFAGLLLIYLSLVIDKETDHGHR